MSLLHDNHHWKPEAKIGFPNDQLDFAEQLTLPTHTLSLFFITYGNKQIINL